MDASLITAWRTGASVGVAARYLARADAECVGVVGCGVQARAAVDALAVVLPELRAVRCFDVVAAAAARFVGELQARHPDLEFVVCDAAHGGAARRRRGRQRDHDDATTPSRRSARACSRRARSPWRSTTTRRGAPRRWPSATGSSATTRPRCWRPRRPARASGASPRRSPATSASSPRAWCPERRDDGERLFCLNLGVAVEDVVTARLVLERARERGAGRSLPL